VFAIWQLSVTKDGKAAPDTKVDENVTFVPEKSKDAPPKGPNVSHRTDAYGHADDRYKFIFSSPDGYVTVRHEYIIGSARGTAPDVKFGANGSITPNPTIKDPQIINLY
jgi:hypothetical protein